MVKLNLLSLMLLAQLMSLAIAVADEVREVQVLVPQNGECRVDAELVPCDLVGEFIRQHSLTRAVIVVRGDPQANYRFIGAVLKSLTDAKVPKVKLGKYPSDGT